MSNAGAGKELASVGLSEIAWEDRSFEVRRFGTGTPLEASLGRRGVLQPPWLLTGPGGRCTIVDGFRRLRWLKENHGPERIECFVHGAGTNRRELMLRRLEIKLSGPPLNVAEKAGIAGLLAGVLPDDPAVAEFLSGAGFAVRPAGVEKWRRLALGGEELLGAAAAGEISERTALDLSCWDDDAKGEALRALREIRCSASIQAEILDRITDLARAGDAGRAEVLRRPEPQAVLNHPEWDRRRKTQALRDLLYRLRYPRLGAREERFRRDVASAGLPGGVRIVAPPAFEGEQWQLQLVFTAPEELKPLLEKAMTLANSPLLPSLMRPAGLSKEK